MTDRDIALAEIASRILRLETLEPRKNDSLDFSEQAVWTIKSALEAAYEAGREYATRRDARSEHAPVPSHQF